MKNTSCNYTDPIFAIQSNAERYSWAVYHLLVLLSSLIGDSLILAASFQRNAFKINKLLVTVIQHIAVSDLASSIFQIIPGAVSLLANSWILGKVMCYITAYAGYFAYAAVMCLIANLTTLKFLILKYPLRTANWSTKRIHQVCCSIWAFCLIMPFLMLAEDRDDVRFSYRSYSCGYKFRAKIWKAMLPLFGFIYTLAPIIVTISATVPTLKHLAAARKSAKRVGRSVPMQGTVTVALTAIVFIITTLPYVTNKVVGQFVKQDCAGCLKIKFYRMICSLLLINTMANFYIYALTIKSFRRFLLSKVLSLTSIPWLNPRDIAPTTGTYKIA
jgi:hypothetical protein